MVLGEMGINRQEGDGLDGIASNDNSISWVDMSQKPNITWMFTNIDVNNE
jgi:hypothetical protein